jgi:membrane peptidoglycan carboxypeptidase
MPRRTLARTLLVAAAALAVAVGAAGAAAWAATPPGTHLARRVELRLAGTGARPLPLRAIAPILRTAVVATEDERFFRHHGIDMIGLARAIPYDVVHLSFAQGASTITEQVAKLLYLDGNDHTPWRKLEDMALAVKLENRYSKPQILAAYLDTAYFGGGAYGVASAAERYFGTTPRRLSLAQATLLAGLPQAPSLYDPLLHPAAARSRQEEVLRSLVRVGAIGVARARAVLARPLPLRGSAPLPPVAGVSLAPGPPVAWVDAAVGLAVAVAGLALLPLRGGRRRLAAHTLALAAAAHVLLGAAAVLRSFRTL